MNALETALAHSATFQSLVVKNGAAAKDGPATVKLDGNGMWFGYIEGAPGETFILLRAQTLRTAQPLRRAADTRQPQSQPARGPVQSVRSKGAVIRPRFRYSVADRRKHPELSATREKVYRALLAAPQGLVYRDLKARTKLVHGSVQQTLNWLRNAGLVAAEEL